MIAAQYITLSELQRRVRQALEERFALPLWVSAEIAEVKVNYSGHCYLELVEKGEGDGVPKAQARSTPASPPISRPRRGSGSPPACAYWPKRR